MQCACAILSSVVCPNVTVCFHTVSQKARFSEKKVTEHKMGVLVFSTIFVWNISRHRKNRTKYDQMCTLVFRFLSDFNESCFSRTDSLNYTNITYHENPSSGNRVVPWGQTDERTHMTKLAVDFRKCANAPKMMVYLIYLINPLSIWIKNKV